jgi:hypothetical protein
MSLSGAIVEHQNSLLQLYRKLEERFEENSIIRTMWRDMAGDVSLQIQSLKSLPPSFWNRFRNAPDDGFESAVKNMPLPSANVAETSLRDSFEVSLRFAEPVVLKIYARLIKLLRENSTAPVLNFYILVKAFVARLVRTTESFAGDPLLIRSAQLLMMGLEKEVQEPAPEIRAQAPKAMPSKVMPSKAPPVKTQKASVSDKTAEARPAKGAAKKTPPKNVKPPVSKPSKAAPVKTKALAGQTPAKTRRA